LSNEAAAAGDRTKQIGERHMPTRKLRIDPVDLHVGSRVRSRRRQLGLSQTELGAAIGIAFQQIQKYEKGTTRISSSRLHQIAEVLKVAPAYFFEDPLATIAINRGKADVSAFDDFCASRDGVALMQAFVKIDKTTQHTIAKLVEQMAK
jgi:transcriptional regulator with XRE-family HTH domain